jgi:nitrogen-specific signal transduction histidine kinase
MEQRDHSPPDGQASKDPLTAADLECIVNPLSVVRGYTQLLQRRLRRGETIEDDVLLRTLDRIDVASQSVTTSVCALAAKCDFDARDHKPE